MTRWTEQRFMTEIYNARYRGAEHFAESAQISVSALRRWMKWDTVPMYPDVAQRVAEMLNSTVEDIWPGYKPRAAQPPVEQNKPQAQITLAERIQQAGMTINEVASKLHVSPRTIRGWSDFGYYPQKAETVWHIAGILQCAPTDIWPDWEEGKHHSKSPAKGASSAWSRGWSDADLTGDVMEGMRRKANVHVGQRFVMTYPGLEYGNNLPCTVVELGENWFRVKYDAGWCECFHYQCRVGKERAYFRPEEKRRKEA